VWGEKKGPRNCTGQAGPGQGGFAKGGKGQGVGLAGEVGLTIAPCFGRLQHFTNKQKANGTCSFDGDLENWVILPRLDSEKKGVGVDEDHRRIKEEWKTFFPTKNLET